MAHGIYIRQAELEEIFELGRDVREKTVRLENLQSNVKALLLSKMPVELGRFDAQLIKKFRRNVPWQRAVIEKLGPEFAQSFKSQFPVSVFCNVQVVEHATLPLWKQGEDDSSSQM